MPHASPAQSDRPVEVINASGQGPAVLVCEHASNHIPARYNHLGLEAEARNSHIAWDPGALGVARHMSAALDAPLVAGRLSRLIFDCNRPPEAPDAIPTRSEVYDIPGNTGLPGPEAARRVREVYDPFHEAVTATLDQSPGAALVTIHSFTPVYRGVMRQVELGILHDNDSRLADAMLGRAAQHPGLILRRNEPYGPQDGVTHMLVRHGLARGIPNVMIEVRNDLIASDTAQAAMADLLCGLLRPALTQPTAKAAP